MALHRYGDFRVEVFYFDSPCIRAPSFLMATELQVFVPVQVTVNATLVWASLVLSNWDW